MSNKREYSQVSVDEVVELGPVQRPSALRARSNITKEASIRASIQGEGRERASRYGYWLNVTRWLHGGLIVVFTINALAIFLLTYQFDMATYSFNVYMSGIGEPNARMDHWPPIANPPSLFSVRLVVINAVFACITLLASVAFLIWSYADSSKNMFFPDEDDDTYRYVNVIRWAEYSLSASLMHVEIAMLSGILDVYALIGVFALTAVTMWLGYLAEEYRSWSAFIIGCVPWLFEWAIIMWSFFYQLESSDGNPPAFVYAVIFIMFFFDTTFAVVCAVSLRENLRFKWYVTEISYLVLSFTSKNILNWVVYGGVTSVGADN